MGQRGKWRKGTIPAEFNRLFASEVQNQKVPNFPSLFGHTHSEVGWLFLLSHKARTFTRRVKSLYYCKYKKLIEPSS